MQGSEQNMDSLPPRHRSIAICNPSPAPPMTATALEGHTKYRTPGNGRPLTGKAGNPPAQPAYCVALAQPVSSSRLRLASHLATTTGPTRFDTLSYEPYVPLQVAVTQQ